MHKAVGRGDDSYCDSIGGRQTRACREVRGGKRRQTARSAARRQSRIRFGAEDNEDAVYRARKVCAVSTGTRSRVDVVVFGVCAGGRGAEWCPTGSRSGELWLVEGAQGRSHGNTRRTLTADRQTDSSGDAVGVERSGRDVAAVLLHYTTVHGGARAAHRPPKPARARAIHPTLHLHSLLLAAAALGSLIGACRGPRSFSVLQKLSSAAHGVDIFFTTPFSSSLLSFERPPARLARVATLQSTGCAVSGARMATLGTLAAIFSSLRLHHPKDDNH